MHEHALREFTDSVQPRQWPTRPVVSVSQRRTTSAPATLPGIAAFLLHQQQPRDPVTSAAFPVYRHAHDQCSHRQRGMTSHHQASSGSPVFNDAPSSGRSSINSSSTGSSSRSATARMQINYKPRATINATRAMTINANKSMLVLPSRPMRTSRYLREADRRNILSRIGDGEKQADLAKEYQVSRAAISNLKQRRNRKELFQYQQQQNGLDTSEQDDRGNRDDEQTMGDGEDSDSVPIRHCKHEVEPQQPGQSSHRVRAAADQSAPVFSLKHETNSQIEAHHQRTHWHCPSKCEQHGHNQSCASNSPYHSSPTVLLSQSPSPPRDEAVEPQLVLELVTEVSSPSMKLLFTRLVDQRTDTTAFGVALMRIARLLLEHALSAFPTRDVRIRVPQQSSTALTSYYLGAEVLRRTCAVTVSESGGGAGASVLLREFQAIEPHSGFGFVAPRPKGDGFDVQVPRKIHERNVVLLVELLDAQSSHHAAKTVQAILKCGVQQEHVVLVTLCSEERTLARVLEAFPGLRVVTSKILSRSSDPTSAELCNMLRSSLVVKGQTDVSFS